MQQLVEILVDVHEKDSDIFNAIGHRKIAYVHSGNLKTGDVILQYQGYTVGIEIKRGSDFDNSLHSGRLHDQLCRLTECFDFPMLIVEAWRGDEIELHRKQSRTINRRICLAHTQDMDETVDIIESIVKDLLKKKLNVLRRPVFVEKSLDPATNILCAFPQVSKNRADEILHKYGNAENAIKHMDEWPDMKIGMTEERVKKCKEAWTE